MPPRFSSFCNKVNKLRIVLYRVISSSPTARWYSAVKNSPSFVNGNLILWVQWKVAILHSYSVTSVTYMRYCMQDKIEPFVMSYYTAITETCPWLLILWNFLATLPVPERRSKVCGVTGDFDLKEWMWLLWDVVWRSKFKSLQCRLSYGRPPNSSWIFWGHWWDVLVTSI